MSASLVAEGATPARVRIPPRSGRDSSCARATSCAWWIRGRASLRPLRGGRGRPLALPVVRPHESPGRPSQRSRRRRDARLGPRARASCRRPGVVIPSPALPRHLATRLASRSLTAQRPSPGPDGSTRALALGRGVRAVAALLALLAGLGGLALLAYIGLKGALPASGLIRWLVGGGGLRAGLALTELEFRMVYPPGNEPRCDGGMLQPACPGIGFGVPSTSSVSGQTATR